MTFNRVSEHVLRCILHEDELIEMRYDLQELLHNQEIAVNFLNDIITKANENGFTMDDDSSKAMQVIKLPDHRIALNIIDVQLAGPINELLNNYLNIYETINSIGKERLIDILHMQGREKVEAFVDCMDEIKQMYLESMQSEVSNNEIEEESVLDEMTDENKMTQYQQTIPDSQQGNQETKAKDYKLLFQFDDLNRIVRFCKEAALAVPGKLYKENEKYFLLSDFHDVEEERIKSFILSASEYSSRIQEDNIQSQFLEEHGEILITENPIETLKKL